jgi:uncharacterized protein YdcH (DUF465 family)
LRVDSHELHHEFPEFHQRIHDLKVGDAHFARLFGEYDALTHEIRNIEAADSRIGDADLEKLKLRRVHLKDTLYAYLQGTTGRR